MSNNNQTTVSRRKNVSSQETKAPSRRDGARKGLHASREMSNSKLLSIDPKKDMEKQLTAATTTKRVSSKSVLKQDSTGAFVSRPQPPADRPIINPSLNSSNLSKLQQKVSSNVAAKPKLKKQSSNEEKRGVSTIYMPKKSLSTSKEQSQITRKDVNRSIVKNKGSSSNSTNANRHERLPSRERRKSRTLSPSEVKMLNKTVNSSNISIKAGASSKQSPEQRNSPSDYEYEDDFEDYESDFQECTDTEASQVSDESEASVSTAEVEPVQLQAQKFKETKLVDNVAVVRKYVEEEHMLDSGHYELQEARRRAARIDLMSANRLTRVPVQTLERPILYADEKPSETKSLPSSADEGFEDGRSGDFAKSPPFPAAFDSVNSTNQNDKVLNKLSRANSQPRLTRGQQLLQMIKLDAVEWSLFECTPIAYEEFIQIHGKTNTRQISTQTNEDSLSVDVQTDEIELTNMWTQFPVACRSVLKTNQDINQFTKELKGVGSDEDNVNPRPQYDILQLNEFLNAAGKVMLALLEGKESQRINLSSEGNNIEQMPFSEATIKLSIASVTFLSGRPVTMIRYSDISSKILLTIHDPAEEEIETAANEDFYITDCCIGCQWDICEPSRPTKLFYSSSNITACCFHPTNYNIVFAGLEDGSLSLWDLGEDESYHRRMIDKDNEAEWTLRSATYNSGGSFNEEQTQTSKIVALKVLSKFEPDPTEAVGKFMTIQICSLDEEGSCVVWSVLRNFDGTTIGQDLGQSWWGKLRLIKSHTIPLHLGKGLDKKNLMRGFRDIHVDSVDSNSLYIATNTSQVLHTTQIGKKSNPSLYDGGDGIGGITCIENCPFGEPYFLVGCEDGNLRLYSSTIARPLLQLKNLINTAPIKIIQWSRSKPLSIFVLDEDSKIHIWDLSKSDIVPTCSISPDKYAHVGSMQLSPCRNDRDLVNQYIALGLDNGNVEVHKFNQQFQYSRKEDVLSELKTFLDYLAIY